MGMRSYSMRRRRTYPPRIQVAAVMLGPLGWVVTFGMATACGIGPAILLWIGVTAFAVWLT